MNIELEEGRRGKNQFNFLKWGPTGVFINDMRGNRITTKGEQRPDNPILNEKQWVFTPFPLSFFFIFIFLFCYVDCFSCFLFCFVLFLFFLLLFVLTLDFRML